MLLWLKKKKEELLLLNYIYLLYMQLSKHLLFVSDNRSFPLSEKPPSDESFGPSANSCWCPAYFPLFSASNHAHLLKIS